MLDLCKIIEIKKSVGESRQTRGRFLRLRLRLALSIVNKSGQNFNLLMRGLNLDLAWYTLEWGLATCLHQFEF